MKNKKNYHIFVRKKENGEETGNPMRNDQDHKGQFKQIEQTNYSRTEVNLVS